MFGTTAAALLQAHPTPEQIAELDLDQLTGLLHTPSRVLPGSTVVTVSGRPRLRRFRKLPAPRLA